MKFETRCRLAAEELNAAAYLMGLGLSTSARSRQSHGLFLADEVRQQKASDKACDEIIAALDAL